MAKGYPSPITVEDSHFDGPRVLLETGLTLIHPFFGERDRFQKLFDVWRSYPDHVKRKLNVVVVDDCGDPPIHELMTPSKIKRCDFNLSVYRITTPLFRNTPGALNLGLMCATTPWSLIMDSDCILKAPEIQHLMWLRPREDWIYHFDRLRVTEDDHLAKNTRFLPCTILMHKHVFLNVGGFDEDFTGEYTGGWAYFDNHFHRKVRIAGYWAGNLKHVLATEYMPDEVGPKLPRSREEEKINKRLMYAKNKGEVECSRHMLRFSWERTFHKRRSS